MARTAKPWWRESRNAWHVTIRGKVHNLGSDKKEAHRRFHELLAQPDDAPPPPKQPTTGPLVAVVIDQFLEWTENNRAAETYVWYRKKLQSFLDSLTDKRLAVADLKPFYVQRWIDSHKTWGDSFKRGGMIGVQRCFTWAERQGIVDRSPVRNLEKPAQGKREQVMTPEHYRLLLASVRHQCIRDMLTFAWECGPRPQELVRIEARHFQRGRLELPRDEAKGKKKWRIIHLTPKAEEIIKRLVGEQPTGPIFRNSEGRPWNPFSIDCLFKRFKDKLGVKYRLYDLRHTYCTRLLLDGVDHLTVAALMGHTDSSMVCRIYSHIGDSGEYLQKKLNGGA